MPAGQIGNRLECSVWVWVLYSWNVCSGNRLEPPDGLLRLRARADVL